MAGLDQLKNRVVFTYGFMEMIFWLWVSIDLLWRLFSGSFCFSSLWGWERKLGGWNFFRLTLLRSVSLKSLLLILFFFAADSYYAS